ncbi:MAG: hypothetical protein V5A81_04665, partial [Candidatus Bipolaricaulota bacterium]
LGFHSGRCLLMAAKAELRNLNKSRYHVSDKSWFSQTYAPRRWNFLGPEPYSCISRSRPSPRARPIVSIKTFF